MSTPAIGSSLVVNIEGLAVALVTSVRSIHRLNACEKIPRPTRLGGQLRWNRAEIEADMPDRRTWERSRRRTRSG
jgi:predicted DNA-binding transcriptional regulator AlpA